MRKFGIKIALLVFFVTFAIASQSWAQSVTVKTPVRTATRVALTTTGPSAPGLERNIPAHESKQDIMLRLQGQMPPGKIDAATQTIPGTSGAPTILTDFDGLNTSDNAFGIAPPDSDGGIGIEHYFEWVNLSIAIYDRTGTRLFGPAPGNTMFTELGGPCESNNDGDPIVLYDQLADRWFVSQFAVTGGPNSLCIAVSDGIDPLTSGWYLYEYDFDPVMPDYEKYGIWDDMYTMTFHGFEPGFTGLRLGAFDRTAMLAGNGTAQLQMFNADAHLSGDFFGALPPRVQGPNTVDSGTPAPFVHMASASGFGGTDRYTILELDVDFATPANTTLTRTDLAAAAFDQNLCGWSRDCIPQPGTTLGLDSFGGNTLFQAPGRDLDATAGVDLRLLGQGPVDVDGSDLAGIRWFELQNTGSGWSIRQEGTFAPADGKHRWMGSIAMNGNGDIAMGYSVSDGTSTYPSIYATGRLAGDPLNTMAQGETLLRAGTGSQTGTSRWGDYAVTNVDPLDDRTFWHVNEFDNTTAWADWGTHISHFELSSGTDTTPPDAVADLIATPVAGGLLNAIVDLAWTAPADDAGNPGSGAAAFYSVAFSDVGPITNDAEFDAATQATGEPLPAAPGSAETFSINTLDFDTQYWFGLRVTGDEGLTSLSNSPETTTGSQPPLPEVDVSPASMSTILPHPETDTQVLTIYNNGGSPLDFSLFTQTDAGPTSPELVAAPAPPGAGTGDGSAFESNNESGMPAAKSTSPAAPGSEFYTLDDGTSEDAIGLVVGGDVMWMNGFEVQPGGAVISSIALAWGTPAGTPPPDGTLTRVFLYDDPTNDGDPTDGILLVDIPTSVANGGTDIFTTVAIPPTLVSGTFFVAALITHSGGTYPAALDQTASQGASWVAGNTVPGGFDVNNLGANDVLPAFIDGIGFPGNWLLRADVGVPWLSFSPGSGSVPASGSVDVDVTFHSDQVDDIGTYEADIVVSSSDPITPLLPVPAVMEVLPGPSPFIVDPLSMDVTIDVRTDPDEMEIRNFTVTNTDPEDPRGFEIEIRGGAGSAPVFDRPDWDEEMEQKWSNFMERSAANAGDASVLPEPYNPDLTVPQFIPIGNAPVGVSAYGFSCGYASPFQGDLIWFDLGEPSLLTAFGSPPGAVYFAGEFLLGEEDFMVVVDNATRNISNVDLATGIVTDIGPVAGIGVGTIMDAAIDPTNGTLYLAVADGPDGTLYTVDPTTGVASTVGDFSGVGGASILTLAVDDTGQMYGYTLNGSPDMLFAIDKATAAATPVGPLGVDPRYNQSMDFDPITGTLYGFMYFGGGAGGLHTIDRLTGAATLVGPFQGDEMCMGALPSGGPGYLSANVLSAVLPPGATLTLDATFDANGFLAGTYYSDLAVIATDAFGTPEDVINTSLTVLADPDITVDPIAHDFGDEFRNGTTGPESFILSNDGREVLNVSSVSLDNTDDFTLDGPASLVLLPGESQEYDVWFHPLTVGPLAGTVTIESDDPDEPTSTVALSGEGTEEPVIAVIPTAFELQAYPGQSQTHSLTVSNTNEANVSGLDWNLSEQNVLAPSVAFIAVLLAEDFDSGTFPPVDPNHGPWTVVDTDPAGPSWATSDVWGDGNYTDGTGLAAESNSDTFGPADFDTELRTPVLPTGGSPDWTLEFSMNYQNWAYSDFLDIDISVDGGTSWTNVVQFNEDHGGFFSPPGEHVFANLAPFLVGATDFIVRWHYYDPATGEWDWYAQIDDVLITAQEFLDVNPDAGLVPGGGSQDLTLDVSAPGASGVYHVDLVFNSNDPVTPELTVPFDLTVIDAVTVVADTDNLAEEVTPSAPTGGGPSAVQSIDGVIPNADFLVPVTVTSLDYLAVEAYQFSLLFDDALLEATGILTDGTLSAGTSTQINILDGRIDIAVAETSAPIIIDPDAIEGEGTLVYVGFHAKTDVHGTSPIAFCDDPESCLEFQMNEGQPPVTTVDGAVDIGIKYGDANVNMDVTASDASKTLKFTVGTATLSPAAFTQADVSGNGSATAFDASQILKYTVGTVTCFSADPTCVAKTQDVVASARLVFGAPEPDDQTGLLYVPLLIQEVQGEITSAQYLLEIDPAKMTVERFEANVPDSWQVDYNTTSDGILKISMAGLTPIYEGAIGELVLRWIEADVMHTLTGQAFVNEGTPQMLEGASLSTIPDHFELDQNYPNPFNPITTISYKLAETVPVKIAIFDVLGRTVRTLVNEEQKAGLHTVQWDSRNDSGESVASGLYMYRMEAGSFVQTRTLMLIK